SSYLFLVFLIIVCLPRSTLFPYTTLFRSIEMAQVLEEGGAAGQRAVADTDDAGIYRAGSAQLDQGAVVAHDAACRIGSAAIREADRKSTRLNSSHGSISYAVFCLKKKKNN